jgi:hypothetical protein
MTSTKGTGLILSLLGVVSIAGACGDNDAADVVATTTSSGTVGGGDGGVGGNGGEGGDEVVGCDPGFECVPSAGSVKNYFTRGVSGGCPPGSEPDFHPWCDAEACECLPFGGSCTTWGALYDDSGCQSPTDSLDGCVDVPNGQVFVQALTSSGCQAAQNTVPSKTMTGCTTYDWKPCTGGVCLPAAAGAQRCAMVNGDCAAPYSEKTQVFAASGPCGCHCSLNGTCDPPSVNVYSDDDCGALEQVVQVSSQCTALANASSVEPASVPGSGSCELLASVITGTITETICCIPQ